MIERVRYERRIDHPIHIAYDEWNVWYRERSPQARRSGLEERYSLADALAVATFLNIFIRHCRSVRMANVAQLVNVIAPIVTNPRGVFLQPIYHPFRLYAEYTREIALDPHVECEAYTLDPGEEDVSERPFQVADLGPFALLDAAATCDAEGRVISLAVVNRDPDHAISTTIRVLDGTIGPTVLAYEVNGEDHEAANSFEHPTAVDVRERRAEGRGDHLSYAFPAHSVTVLLLPID
jgi:alpha-N-arabinofuranosidase